tara:strand:+ start:294 stop:1637 length:1344 start_codon:yes stop_codon:yes gene_type:complete
MSDDQGWGQTGYYDHPILKTPNLDAMERNGLRFDRFYAGAPVCSPTRASVMTGRSNDRCGVFSHGCPLCLQEKTIAQAMQSAWYSTGHFGKWHLSGFMGPGAPILEENPRHPGHFGFDHWLSVTNFFDRDPLMSRLGSFEEFEGDSSDVAMEQAIHFIRTEHARGNPFFTVIWYGTPHSPWIAGEDDKVDFAQLSDIEQNHYGELVAMDRSIGALRLALRELQIEEDTLVWFNSDNGGLEPFGPATVGGLRGWKGTLYEGGLRVPAVIEWPKGIPNPRRTSYPASTMDIFPTVIKVCGIDDSVLVQRQDGRSLDALFQNELGPRKVPIPCRYNGGGALVDNDRKLVVRDVKGDDVELFDLADDPRETTDLSESQPDRVAEMKERYDEWNLEVEASLRGEDYTEGTITVPNPERRDWMLDPSYELLIPEWKDRPEFQTRWERLQETGG